jgi:hypothetical protein
MPQPTSEARKAARASRAVAGASGRRRPFWNPEATSALQVRPRRFTHCNSKAAENSPSRKRAISLVPPTMRQSIATVRPVRRWYHSAKPRAYSWRIASLWGVMTTTVSSVRRAASALGLRANGSATSATSVRTIKARFMPGTDPARAQSARTTTSSGSARAKTSPCPDFSRNRGFSSMTFSVRSPACNAYWASSPR